MCLCFPIKNRRFFLCLVCHGFNFLWHQFFHSLHLWIFFTAAEFFSFLAIYFLISSIFTLPCPPLFVYLFLRLPLLPFWRSQRDRSLPIPPLVCVIRSSPGTMGHPGSCRGAGVGTRPGSVASYFLHILWTRTQLRSLVRLQGRLGNI